MLQTGFLLIEDGVPEWFCSASGMIASMFAKMKRQCLLLAKDEKGHSPYPEMIMGMTMATIALPGLMLISIHFPNLSPTVAALIVGAVVIPLGMAAQHWAEKHQRWWMIEVLNAWFHWLRYGLPRGKSMEQLAAGYFKQCSNYDNCEFRPSIRIEKRGILKRLHLVFGDYETYCVWKSFRNWPGIEADLARLGLTKLDLLVIPDNRCCWERSVPNLPPLCIWPPRCERNIAAVAEEK